MEYRIKVGSCCNSNCIYCELLDKKIDKERTTDQIKKELKSINKDKINEIIFPCNFDIRKDAVEILDFAKELGFKIILESNGRMFFYKDFYEKVVPYVDQFNVFFNGYNDRIHDKITRTDKSFKQLVKGLYNLNEKKIVAIVVITESNYKHLNEICEFISNFFIKKIQFIYPFDGRNIPNVADAAEYIEDAMQFAKERRLKVITGIAPFDPLKPKDISFEPPEDIKPLYEVKIDEKEKEASIIIPTLNKKKELKLCLVSLFNQSFPKNKYEVVVVDDGSNDNTLEMIKTLKPSCNFKYFYWPRERPFKSGEPVNRAGPARNLGIKKAKGKVVIFLDSDIVAVPELIEKHIEAHKKGDRLLVLGYRTWMIENEGLITEDIIVNDFDKIRKFVTLPGMREIFYSYCNDDINKLKIPWIVTWSNNLSIKKDHILEVGCFDDCFIFWGTEDLELGYRLYKNNFKFILERAAIGYHLYSTREYKWDLYNKFDMEKYNMTLFYKKHLDFMISRIIEFYHLGFFSIELGYKCNNNCIICNLLNKKFPIIFSFETVKKILDKLKEKEFSHVFFSGGEPVLREDFIDILDYAKGLGFIQGLSMNGQQFSDKEICKQLSSRINIFCIYFLGHTLDVYEKITQIKGSFDKAVQGIKNVLEFNDDIFVYVPITKLNYKSLKEILEFLINLGVKQIEFNYPNGLFEVQDPSYFHVEHSNLLLSLNYIINFSEALPYIYEVYNFAKNKNINFYFTSIVLSLCSIKFPERKRPFFKYYNMQNEVPKT